MKAQPGGPRRRAGGSCHDRVNHEALDRPSLRRCTALLLALTTLLFLTVATTKPASAAPLSSQIPVTGTSAAGPVAGTFDIQRFAKQDGQLVAVGTFTGTQGVTGSQQIALPVDLQQTTGSCDILNLVLGPLHLDLLGLVVDLNQVELNITADQGPGNLLGNLLCAVAGLLDGPGGALGGLAALLNRILAILGG